MRLATRARQHVGAAAERYSGWSVFSGNDA